MIAAVFKAAVFLWAVLFIEGPLLAEGSQSLEFEQNLGLSVCCRAKADIFNPLLIAIKANRIVISYSVYVR